eukprot:2179689-Rhodomonas_salina.1
MGGFTAAATEGAAQAGPSSLLRVLLRVCSTMFGTDIAYGVLSSYTMFGTETAYGVLSSSACAVRGTVIAYGVLSSNAHAMSGRKGKEPAQGGSQRAHAYMNAFFICIRVSALGFQY